LEERELAVFLSSQFGIPTDLEAPHLAFGRGADAFIDVEAEIDGLIDKLTEIVTTEFRQANRHARRALLSRGLPLPPRSSITNIPSAVLDVFYEPGVADQLIGPAPMIAKKRIAQRV
jgi:hypothetical protein